MKYYKVDYEWLQQGLSDIADIIREKLKIENQKFSFPEGYKTILKEKLGNSDVEDALIEGTLAGIYENSRIKQIRPYAFENFTGLTEVKIPNVTYIGEYAFTGCENLSKIEIPDGVTSISSGTFYDCTSLTSVTIPEGVTRIRTEAFYNCSSLTDVYYGGSESQWNDISINSGNTSLTNATIHYGKVEYTDSYFTCVAIDGKATITEFSADYEGDVVIPDTLGGYSVVAIGDGVFAFRPGLTSISIPDRVTNIGIEAFYFCYDLTSINVSENNNVYKDIDGVLFTKDGETLIQYPIGKANTTYTIPNSVISIGDYAFSYCTNLTSISIPEGVTSIGDYAFSDCINLTNINVSENNTVYKDIDGVLFTKDDKTLIQYPAGKTDSIYTVSDRVTSISDYAFSACENLTSVIIPDSVTSIGDYAFHYCIKLTSIIIPNSITNINEGAFSACINLKSINIPDSVTTIGNGAFSGCNSLDSINIPNSVISIGDYAFENCSNIRHVYYSGNESQWNDVSIGFANTSLTEAIIYYDKLYAYIISEDKVIITGANPSISGEVVIPDTLEGYPVKEISDWAFYGCSSFTSVIILDGVTSIGEGAFCDCINLMSINIPNSVSSIGYLAFSYCIKITNITVDPNNQYYTSENGVLFNKDKTEIIRYPAGKIDTTYIVPDSVTSIGASAFDSCINLTDITIPDSVTNIGFYAFDGYDNFIIYCPIDSYAEEYAIDNKIPFVYADEITDISILTLPTKTKYPIDGVLNLDGLSLIITLSDGTEREITRGYLVSEYDFSIEGTKTIIISIGNKSAQFEVEVDPNLVAFPESNHYPYHNNMDKTWIYTHKTEAYALQVTFSDETEVEDGYDWIYIYNANNEEISVWTGTELAGYTVTIPGNSFSIKLTSNKTNSHYYGFSITNIAAIYKDDSTGIVCNEEGIVIDYEGNGGEVIIPNTINEYPIVCIGEGVFYNCESLTSIEIPSSVTSIDYVAFYGCTNLTSVTIPNSVTIIGEGAFYNCTNLTSITIPNSVMSIGDYAFLNTGYYNDTSNWENDALYIGNHLIKVNSSVSNYTVKNGTIIIGGGAFSGCSILTSITIPDSVTSIGYLAFYNCTSLTSITIPESVTSIGNFAFQECTSLKGVVIPDSVVNIGIFAFNNCLSLTSIIIPDSVTSIGDSAFSGCSNLMSISVSENNTVYKDIEGVLFTEDGETLIQYPNGKTNITYIIPSNVTSISSYAFYHCTNLANITIPEGVVSVNRSAFEDCTSLTNITIPDSVVNIDYGAFQGCSSLMSVAIGNSVTNIGWWVFGGCTSLTSIAIPNSVTNIGNWAFSDCFSLTNVYYNGNESRWNNISIGDDGNISLMEATIHYNKLYAYIISEGTLIITDTSPSISGDIVVPDTLDGYSVKAIGDMAFYKCDKITRVTIPEGVTSIGEETFAYCSSLREIDMPQSLKTIGFRAFIDCIALEKINGELSLENLEDEAFYDCINLAKITIVSMDTEINGYPFVGCDDLTIYCYHSSDIHVHAATYNLKFELIPII